MLSHQTSNMDQRTLRQHRRQQSTPTFEVSHMSNFPANQQPGSHRRGMSLNQPTPQIHQHRPQEDQHMVSITNPGQPTQHYLQEAQQHCQALPGLPEQQQHYMEIEHMRMRRHQEVDAEIASFIRQNNATHSFAPAGEQHMQKMERSRSNPYDGVGFVPIPEGNVAAAANGGLLGPFHAHSHYNSKRPSTSDNNSSFGGMRSQQPNWHHRMQRPVTPLEKSNTEHALETPDTSPYMMARVDSPQREASPESYDAMDTGVTIKPKRHQRQTVTLSHQFFETSSSAGRADNGSSPANGRSVFAHGLSQAEMFKLDAGYEHLPSPPQSAPLRQGRSFEVPVMPGELMQLPNGEHVFIPQTPMPNSAMSSPYMSHHASPQRRSRQGGDVAGMTGVGLDYGHSSPMRSGGDSADFGRGGSPSDYHQGSEELMADLHLDATIEDTGISAEEVQAYISDADPNDGKWTCKFPDCGKRFGRKENVRAHVQTHLGDRQFKCIHCGKCFVRQHDLKRHSKTHSGVKPYPCDCGASFARHDALTRHRQRNVCLGGFDGYVKKAAKRGRPRKNRPDDDERANKAALTRKRNAGTQSYPSSVSGYSESSRGYSPQSEALSELEIALGYQKSPHQSLQAFTLHPDMLTRTPPMSPHSTGNAQSPRKAPSTTAGRSPRAPFDDDHHGTSPQHHGNDDDGYGTGASSHFGSVASSPPELSHSSPAATQDFLDFDMGGNLKHHEDSGVAASSSGEQTSPVFESDSFSNTPDDLFSDAFTGDGWKADSYINFDDGETSNFQDVKFTHSFDDELLFSDNVQEGDHYFSAR